MYKVVSVKGREHVITEQKYHRTLPYNDANYMNTGMCLCGVLNENETLEQWMKRTNKVKLKSRKNDSRSKKNRYDNVNQSN